MLAKPRLEAEKAVFLEQPAPHRRAGEFACKATMSGDGSTHVVTHPKLDICL